MGEPEMLSPQHQIVAYPKHWQRPAATEETAFAAMNALGTALPFEYYGFAWATLMDGLEKRTHASKDILKTLLSQTQNRSARSNEKRVTVAQHIRAANYFDLFKALGITDVFWSHAVRGQEELQGLRLHPFPLFPAQAPTYEGQNHAQKTHLANFVGAFNPTIYLSNVRAVIFEDADTLPDVHIVKRERWHFDRAVYDEQISGQTASQAQLAAEARMKDDYLDAIRQSWFTLCPTGSGPNSIRIFESLALGSIPIILSRDLKLAGPSDLWERAAITEEDSEEGYRRGLERARQTPESKRLEMMAAGKELFKRVGPDAYGSLILQAMQ